MGYKTEQEMKNFKFRIWMREEKNFIHFERLIDICSRFGDEHVKNRDYLTEVLSEPQLWTGIQDKNRKDVYQGDIVVCELLKGEVTYQEEEGAFFIDHHTYLYAAIFSENRIQMEGDTVTIKKKKVIEVIGNIYENPELREENE